MHSEAHLRLHLNQANRVRWQQMLLTLVRIFGKRGIEEFSAKKKKVATASGGDVDREKKINLRRVACGTPVVL